MAFLQTSFLQNTFWQYLVFIIYVVGAFIGAKLLYFFIQKVVKAFTAKSKTKLDDILVDMIEEPAVVFIVILGIHIGWHQLTFDNNATVSLWYGKILFTAIVLNVSWLVARLVESLLKNYVTPLASKTSSDLDDHLLPILIRIAKMAVYAIGLVMILNHFGLEIGPLLAGLGIGGVAFAFAAKDLISNVFGSATVIMDKPFVVGQKIRIGGYEGIVKEVNLRTTKVETIEGTVIYVPNAKFTDSIIENVTQEKARKVKLNLALSVHTSNKQIKQSIELIKNILEKHKKVLKDKSVYFTDITNYALNIEVIYWISDKDNALPIRNEINLAIKEALENEHIELTSPRLAK